MASWRAFHIRNSEFLRRQAGDVNRAVGAHGHAPPRSLAEEIEFAHAIPGRRTVPAPIDSSPEPSSAVRLLPRHGSSAMPEVHVRAALADR